VVVEEQAEIGPVPSYSSLRRFMQEQGLLKQRRRRGAAQRGEPRDVGSLWHLDFHHASRSVLTPEGAWVRPVVLGILDDRSRLLCHAQWYLRETAENLVHGLTQAFLKRGLPASLLTDNGSAMIAAETTQGLRRLSVEHRTTLPYSPHQNGKQESFWGQLEGRCLKMLENVPDLTLGLLNEATQAWLEMEYQRAVHSETGQAPMTRWLDGPSVARHVTEHPNPASEERLKGGHFR
jgi:putative transposase